MKAANESTGEPNVHDLKEMLQYQDKSIVSRMLAKNLGGHGHLRQPARPVADAGSSNAAAAVSYP